MLPLSPYLSTTSVGLLCNNRGLHWKNCKPEIHLKKYKESLEKPEATEDIKTKTPEEILASETTAAANSKYSLTLS